MGENKYRVIERKTVLADNMSLEMALLFIEAYCNKYYMENAELVIQRYSLNTVDNEMPTR